MGQFGKRLNLIEEIISAKDETIENSTLNSNSYEISPKPGVIMC